MKLGVTVFMWDFYNMGIGYAADGHRKRRRIAKRLVSKAWRRDSRQAVREGLADMEGVKCV